MGSPSPTLKRCRQPRRPTRSAGTATNVNRRMIVTPRRRPSNRDLQGAAMALSSTARPLSTPHRGPGRIRAAPCCQPPECVWGMPTKAANTARFMNPDLATNRAAARTIMQKLGYGPDNRLPVPQAVHPQHIRLSRSSGDPLSQLREIYMDASSNRVDTCSGNPRSAAKEYLGPQLTETASTTDRAFLRKLLCGADRNYDRLLQPRG